MATHPLIITEGIVLEKRRVGEANTLATVLTRDRGLIRGKAQSTRVMRSKLRYTLEPLSVARFSLVRGAYEWKIVNSYPHALTEGNPLERFAGSPRYGRSAIGKIVQLLTRLIHGEEALPALYEDVVSGIMLLLRARTHEDVDAIESVLVLRILYHLGYMPRTPELAPFFEDGALTEDHCARAALSRSALIRSINESLAATGL
ncbi:MAG TPA: recombination protein O N-terminal domain-containing protein [Candidatus Paceibacterota bacterium]